MTTNEIRQAFLDFFAARGHTVVPSSSLVPANDPTLLFTNAGMVQFKDVFLGREQRDYTRATSSQRCVRAGGKHNDLENVGYTARHHTFFEMLGNFSFGDYFKRDAILYAWTLMTEVFHLPAERLWATVYATDDAAYDVFANGVGVPAARIVRLGDKPGGRKFESDNFWQMADTGPCGPCAEIFYDHGPGIAGGPPGSSAADGDRYVEIWNLVFMQYDRAADGTMTPLPAPCVDTGMGLERIAAVLQGVHSNYRIDLFRTLIGAAAEVTGTRDLSSSSLKVIADHIRASAFLIADGVVPANEGRGYVLRRIIRRAIRHGYKLGRTEPFFHCLVGPLAREMSAAYPLLVEFHSRIEATLLDEENRFAETLHHGMRLLEDTLDALPGKVLPGAVVFKLYDTYGFPVDLSADVARERGLTVDLDGFEREMQCQRERARAASRFGADYSRGGEIEVTSEFSGYDRVDDRARVIALYRESAPVQSLEPGMEGLVVLDNTPFYAESGGQVGDTGILEGSGGRFRVTDTQKRVPAHVHLGTLEQGRLQVGDTVTARVDAERRGDIMRNHSATHLLHAALREALGEHVVQKGSLVAPDRLRFDFSHPGLIDAETLVRIEDRANEWIRANLEGETRRLPYAEAVASGALALFGEKYGDVVRVLRFGAVSVELCGGTHVERTGDIGLFKIVSESGVAAEVRRIEAVTGRGAIAFVRRQEQWLAEIAAEFKSGREDAATRVRRLAERTRELEKELERLRERLAGGQGADLASRAQEIDGHRVLAARLDGVDAKGLRAAVDRLKETLGSAAIVLAAVEGGKVRLAAGVTADLATKIPAGELVNTVAGQVGGRGGGRTDFAQAGGARPEGLDAALASVSGWVRQRLARG